MIRPLIPPDVARWAFLTQEERQTRAYTLQRLCNSNPTVASLMRASVSEMFLKGGHSGWVWHKGRHIHGVLTVAPRSGHRSWEITHLSIKPGYESDSLDILDKAALAAVSEGAEKVFIRTLREDPLVDAARASGYFPRLPEVLFTKESEHSSNASATSNNASISPKRPVEEHDLFRLYNAATPSEVRYGIGMTIDQWQASRERPRGKSQEFVWRSDDGRVAGWIVVAQKGNEGYLSVTMHPEFESNTEALVDYAFEQLEGVRSYYAVVPEYQVALKSVLERRGFTARRDLVTLVKSTAIGILDKSRMRVAAPTGW